MPRRDEKSAGSGLYNFMWVTYTACTFALACSMCNTTCSESRLTTVWYTVQCGVTYHYVKRTTPYVSGRSGVSRIRTDDLLLAKQVLYQLSYNPDRIWNVDFGVRNDPTNLPSRIPYSEFSIPHSSFEGVGLDGIEPPTSRLSGVRSNQPELQPQMQVRPAEAGCASILSALSVPNCNEAYSARVGLYLNKCPERLREGKHSESCRFRPTRGRRMPSSKKLFRR